MIQLRNFNTDDIRIMAAFENITKVGVRDCIRKEVIYFLVDQGKAAIAIGRNGQTIKLAERMLGRPIKVFEWSEDREELVKNLFPRAKRIEIIGNGIRIKIESKDKGSVIGKEGSNIKIIRELLERNSDIKEVKIL